ncbi:hypothetical protein KPH14_011088 [Odynerus spinipes]|uniref:Uncharacterized protein n=1 Tax=Odynerus spinipes TaxID=1348599 RepID=A0AAD9RH89_9HYME|nr:hypothetical protein KPH14_011088 [Odynerus spinipes]
MVSMVSSAVLGAAAGTGLALVVAMTIVVYRYYAFKRKGKYWSNLDRWPDPPTTNKNNKEASQLHRHQYNDSGATSYVMECWRKPQQSYYAVQTTVSTRFMFFNIKLAFVLFASILKFSELWYIRRRSNLTNLSLVDTTDLDF